MNNPNPLIPQGSLLEQKAKGKPHLRVAYIIVAVHLVFLGGLLIQGCKKDDQSGARASQTTNDSALPPLDAGNLYSTNAAASQTNPSQQEIATAPPATNLTLPNPGATPPLEAGATRDYVVVKGDNFTTIARKFGVTPTAVAKANPGVNSTQLKVGQKLVVPAAGSTAMVAAIGTNGGENLYVIKTGDTLSKIATAHSTSVTELKSLNGLKT